MMGCEKERKVLQKINLYIEKLKKSFIIKIIC